MIRHGKIQLPDDQRRYVGQTDLPLSEQGVRQANCLRKYLEPMDIGAVYCSDLARARQTAELIAEDQSLAVVACSELREIHLGEWENCSFSDISRRFPAEFLARGADIGYYRIPGGESFADCSKRAVAAFHRILESAGGNLAIVAHAGVNRLLLCHMLGMPIANLFRLTQDYACINLIQYAKTGFQVKFMNQGLPSNSQT